MTAASNSTPRETEEPSYVDYETFLAPDFAPAAFANSLVVATNNPNDLPLDLSTPLSRVLFDSQEVDSHIDQLTTRSAVPLLQHTQDQTTASKRIITELDSQIRSLNDSYKQLEKEVIDKHAEADEVRQVALRLWETLRLGRSVGRCLQLGRQLEIQHAELGSASSSKDDHGALVRCSYTILSLREILESKAPGEEGHGLGRVDAVRSLQESIVGPIERSVRETSERIVRDFTIPSNISFAQGEEARARLGSAMTVLFLLSPTQGIKSEKWTPRLLLQNLETYIRSALQTSITNLARSLGQLPTLDKALSEVALKCQSLVSLELILESTKPPSHPLLPATAQPKIPNLLQPLLSHLETGSLPSYFWRTMASSLAARVQDIVARGGVVARTLKSNKSNVGDAIRQTVVKASQPPNAMAGGKAKGKVEGNWDREVAVMVGSVVNNLGRYFTMAPNQGLVHLKEYDIKDSNVELIGSDIDHRVKYNSAATEPAWNDGAVGIKPGLLIWRIEDFQVVPLPREKYGQFFDGDSYIVLHSFSVGEQKETLVHDIFFWLGAHTSQDEAGVAAYKTVELDEFLHGKATQHREVQQAPSDDFLALFPRISIRSGGVSSGFRHVEEETKPEVTTLLRVFKNPSTSGVVVHEVEPTWQSLDDGDVFILDKGDKIWVWQGRSCSPMEKGKAAQVVHDMTLAKHVDVEVLAQSESRSRRVVDLLGGDESTPREGFQHRRPVESSSGRSSAARRSRQLFRLSDASGQLAFDKIGDGDRITRDLLDSSDVFLLDDAGKAVWVWEGQGASRAERAKWLQVAQMYVRHIQGDDEEAYLTPIAKVHEGNESQAFLRAIKV
ncbi:Severin [Paramyrothecium foliicola]|nr:Severin [Paramyrothecium foliicola]